MLEQEATIKELRSSNEHLRNEQEELRVQRDAAEAAASAAITDATAVKSGRVSPTAQMAALTREHMADLELLRSERSDFEKLQDGHEEEIARLQTLHAQELEQLHSKLRAGELSFDALEEAAADMQHELMELEDLRDKNAELTDLIDERLGMEAELAEIQNAKLASATGVEVEADFSKFAFEMAEVELERLKKANEKLTEKSKMFDTRYSAQAKELAKAKNGHSTADAKLKGMEQELSATVTHNSGLVVQIEALGMALSKMKGRVDTTRTKGGFLSSASRRSVPLSSLSKASATASPKPKAKRLTPTAASAAASAPTSTPTTAAAATSAAKPAAPSTPTTLSKESAVGNSDRKRQGASTPRLTQAARPAAAAAAGRKKGGVIAIGAGTPIPFKYPPARTKPSSAPTAAPAAVSEPTNKRGLLARLGAALKRNSNASMISAVKVTPPLNQVEAATARAPPAPAAIAPVAAATDRGGAGEKKTAGTTNQNEGMATVVRAEGAEEAAEAVEAAAEAASKVAVQHDATAQEAVIVGVGVGVGGGVVVRAESGGDGAHTGADAVLPAASVNNQ